MRPLRAAGGPLAATSFHQTLCALALFCVPTLAPAIADDTQIPARYAGFYTSLVFLGAMTGATLAGLPIARLGPVRTVQLGAALMAPALLLANWGSSVGIALSAVLLGYGYGPSTPACSQILARTTPLSVRGLVISIKQSGAPLGVFLAGVALPTLAERWGWRYAALAAALLLLTAVPALQPLRPLDTDRPTPPRGSGPAPIRPLAALRVLFSVPQLRRMAIASAAYAVLQATLFSLLVTYLTEEIQVGHITAGFAASSAQLGGLTFRVGWGFLADLLGRTSLLFGLLGIGAGVAVFCLLQVEPSWPLLALYGVCFGAGATVAGWNGIFLAELSRGLPAEQVGAATGSALFLTYGGLLLGPTLASLAIGLSGYGLAFGGAAAIACAAGLWVCWGR